MKESVERLSGTWNPNSDVERFFEHMERWKRPLYIFEKAWKPRCDVSETEGEIIIVADLGNVDADEIDIKAVGSNLVIKGVRREPSQESRRIYHLMEISYGPFERVIELPALVDAEKAEAVYEEGFLEIRLPKMRRSSKGVEVDVE